MKYFRVSPERRRENRIMWCVCAACVLFAALFALGYAGIRSQAKGVPGSDTAERWTASDSPYHYSHLSAYFGDSAAFSMDTLYSRRMQLAVKLEENAISAANPGARTYFDCFTGETYISLQAVRGTAQVLATAAGGAFFYFHPMELVSGAYFSEDDVDVNTVILDEYAAWQLFGAIDVTGLDVTLQDQPFKIVGVVRSPENPVDKLAYGDNSRVYINYKGLHFVQGFDSITTYEVLLPNPIKDFAAKLVSETFGITEKSRDAVVYDSTTRFAFETLAKQVTGLFERSMRRDKVMPPWWENAARVAETKSVVIAGLAAAAGILAGILLAAFVVLWFRVHPVRVKAIYEYFDEKAERKRMKKWVLTHSDDKGLGK
ncbi:MAG: ABC transporter permease [Clostridia bacterium]|nr:ABC transporter permease [Clostridia bacterium]